MKLKKNTQLKGKTSLIDTPGYGDTKGILTIMANGYYHYRLYSKVKNMKFILCFDANSLKNTASDFIDTIIKWTASFKDYLSVRKSIWRSCVFMFTKVQVDSSKEDVVLRLKAIKRDLKTQHDSEVQDALKELIEYIVLEDRIFLIKKLNQGSTATGGDTLD